MPTILGGIFSKKSRYAEVDRSECKSQFSLSLITPEMWARSLASAPRCDHWRSGCVRVAVRMEQGAAKCLAQEDLVPLTLRPVHSVPSCWE